MEAKTKESMELEVQQGIIEALKRAEAEGQPVEELFEAVQKGRELEAWLEPAYGNRYQLVIMVKEK